ncbi:MAG: beta-lactamase family protein [Chloroflexota bacterium]|nr:beta-lactamase family protein [Chloroflexota bacterium]
MTAEHSAPADTKAQSLEDVLQEAMDRFHVPGVAVGIFHDGQEEIVCRGVTSIANPLPVDDHTLFQIGSTTKTVTGTAIMRLVEEGKIDLDAPVRTYLPELRLADQSVAEAVTVRQLLNHTAGWEGDFFADPGRGDDALARIVELLADRPQVTPLGEIWSYNNAAFYIAGRLIEVVTGKPYEVAARELVLDPLGMKESFFLPEEVMTYRFAVGHDIREDEAKIARPWQLPRAANPAGGIASSVRDQLRYARFQMGDGSVEDGTRILTPETMRLMQTPTVAAANDDFCALPWFIRESRGVREVSHGGGTNGQQSAFHLVPERGFAVTVLTNADRGGQLGTEIVNWALEHYLDIRDIEPERLDVGEEKLAEYAGTYTSAMLELELSVRDGTLMLAMRNTGGLPGMEELPPPPPPTTVAVIGEDKILTLDPPIEDIRGEFLRGPDGRIVWFRAGGRVHKRQV